MADRRTRLVLAVLVLGATVVGSAAWAVSSTSSSGPRTIEQAADSAPDEFLTDYELPDGRVVRTDQGGDTVSEGQADAMLIAAASGQEGRFLAAWQWTEANLMEPDGLPAWHWADGHVVDPNSATDADVDTAAALLLAGARFHQPGLTSAGAAVATAVLAHEVGESAEGPVLVAGPWALAPPPVVDPSYLAPPLLDELAGRLGGEWRALAASSSAQLEALTARGRLPPDWAVVGSNGWLQAAPPPGDPNAPVVYGYDAVRVPIWLASTCSHSDQLAAAGLLSAMGRGQGELDLDLGGRPDPGAPSPAALVAQAASTSATGRTWAAAALFAQAVSDNDAHPTYYSSALIALAELGLTHHLGTC